MKYHTKIVNNFVNDIIKQRIDSLNSKTPKLNNQTDIAGQSNTNTPITPNTINKKLFERYDLLSLFLKDNSQMTHKQRLEILQWHLSLLEGL